MKQVCILLTAFLLIIGLHIFQNEYLKRTSRYLFTDLKSIELALRREDFEEANKQVEYLNKTWKGLQEYWDSFGEHDSVEEITESISTLENYIKLEEKTEAIIEANNVKSNIYFVLEGEKVIIGNVL